jgi:NAD(P)-dependent dehydrogenase (short-subunit alcohol dehydrogenase family)
MKRKQGLDPQQQGLVVSPSPLEERRAKDGPPRQRQEWPGRENDLRPLADHGEMTYRGAGKLEGRKALITGGDSGIGRAVAIAFAREGADVAIAYYNEDGDAWETIRWIEAADRRGLAFAGDLRDPDHCRNVVEWTVQGLGGLNILVNNAGFHRERRDFSKVSAEQLDQTFRTNVFAQIWLAQAALKHMKEGDVIINTGSVVGVSGHPSLIDYAATKAAIHNFTKSLAMLVSSRGIRVNCVAPGPVWTPLIPATREEDSVGGFGAATFWKRPAQPAEIAPSYVFLASADSRYCTGEILAITGSATTTH